MFDERVVLDGAIRTFSMKGFSAAAIADLTEVTGLSVSSLYKAYHDKEGIFAQALERYVAVREEAIAGAMRDARSGRERVAAILQLYASLSQGEQGRRGCMVVAGVAELDTLGDAAAARIREVMGRRRASAAASR